MEFTSTIILCCVWSCYASAFPLYQFMKRYVPPPPPTPVKKCVFSLAHLFLYCCRWLAHGTDQQRSVEEELRKAEAALKQSKQKDYYKILGIPRSADKKVVKKAYRELALLWHPDKHNGEDEKAKAEQKFQLIAEAHEVSGMGGYRVHYEYDLTHLLLLYCMLLCYYMLGMECLHSILSHRIRPVATTLMLTRFIQFPTGPQWRRNEGKVRPRRGGVREPRGRRGGTARVQSFSAYETWWRGTAL